MAHGQNIVARLQHATGNANVTLLLMRLSHWLAKPVAVQIEGEPWVANSTEEWGEDSGLSTTQAKYAGEVARKLNLMKTTMRWHRKRWIMHATTTPRARAIIAGAEDECLSDEGTGDPQCGAAVPALMKEQIESKKEEQIEKDSETLPEGSVPPQIEDQNQGGAGDESEKGKTMKVSDVMKAQAGKKILHKVDGNKALEMLWLAKMAEITKGFVTATNKDRGMLKNFRAKCPEGRAEQALAWTLDNWHTFAHAVQADAGLKSVPEKPALGFILLYAANAVGMAFKVKAAPTQAAGTPIVVNELQSISPTPPKTVYANMSAKLQAQNPEKKYPTWEELNAEPDEES